MSYVREDSAEVDRLAEFLRSYGISVWVDRNELEPGARWELAIRRAIESGAFFLACFSRAFNARTTTYMDEELAIATEVLRLRARDHAWFLPVVLDGGGVPDRPIGRGDTLRSLQHVDLSRDWTAGARRLAETIQPQSRIGRELPRPRQSPPPSLRATLPKTLLCAVDFGTSVSCIGVCSLSRERVLLPDADNRLFTPSVITFDHRLDFAIGDRALAMSLTYPTRTFFNIKRHLIRDVPIRVDGYDFPPVIVAAAFIRALVSRAEEYLGDSIRDIIAAVPANFSIAQANRFAHAFELANLRIRRLIGEPCAAGVLLTEQEPTPARRFILSLDLGGGTFDAAIIDSGDGVNETLAVVGDNSLGGADFDEVLLEYLIAQLVQAGASLPLPPGLLLMLRQDATRAKIALTASDSTTIHVMSVFDGPSGPVSVPVHLDRPLFRSLTAGLCNRIESCIDRVLTLAGIDRAAVTKIMLAGHGMRIFSVHESIQRMFPSTPVEARFQESAVIAGLTDYSGVLSGARKDLLLLDSNYTTLAVRVAGRSRPDDDPDCSFSPEASANTSLLTLLAAGHTVPTSQLYSAKVLARGNISVEVVEFGNLRESEDIVTVGTAMVNDAEAGDAWELEISADANRTIVLRISCARRKQIRLFQLNNLFAASTRHDSLRVQALVDRGYTVLPVVRIMS